MKTLGQIAYEAQVQYMHDVLGFAVLDQDRWGVLTNAARETWEHTAEVIEKEVKSRMEPDE